MVPPVWLSMGVLATQTIAGSAGKKKKEVIAPEKTRASLIQSRVLSTTACGK